MTHEELIERLLLTAILMSLMLCASCGRQVVIREVKVPVPTKAQCLDRPAPKSRKWAYPLEGGICPEGYACITQTDARSIRDEMAERRVWDESAVCQ